MLRQHLEQRRRILLAVEEIVIEKLHCIDAQLGGQITQVPIQPRRRGQGGLTAKHGGDAAKGATESTTESCLVAGGAPAQKGPRQVVARISDAFVWQGACQ